jgi:hypothetical protein
LLSMTLAHPISHIIFRYILISCMEVYLFLSAYLIKCILTCVNGYLVLAHHRVLCFRPYCLLIILPSTCYAVPTLSIVCIYVLFLLCLSMFWHLIEYSHSNLWKWLII